MKLRNILVGALLAASCTLFAQETVYKFTKVVEHPATPVKDQAKTGTCWCYGTTSFIESEIIRLGKGEIDLSEMFTVRHNYNKRIYDNYIRRGRGNITPGSLAHMAINMMDKYGLVPEYAYEGINYDSEKHNHDEMSMYIKALASVTTERKVVTPESKKLQEALFDIYLGELPETFEYKGKEYTPASFKEYLGLDFSDYVEITSFTHHPFYQKVQVEVPDNWDHGTMYNVPIEEFINIIDYSLHNGYTLIWDGDCSEAGYVFERELCIVPQDTKLTRKQILEATEIIPEIEVTQEIRQQFFETFLTVDDHLEHITGIYTDQNGVKYYNTKNSWGLDRNGTGYHKMSENFVKGKTISILVNKNGIPKDIRKKLGL
jgi:bleomycin hydrolase